MRTAALSIQGAGGDTNIGSSALFVKGNGGNVGIGISSPRAKLDVNGLLNVRGSFKTRLEGIQQLRFERGSQINMYQVSSGS
jgi:hypothetical protein